MAARRGDSELLKHLLQLKDEEEEEEFPRGTLDPQLFMAARRGDSKRLKHLLQLKDEEDANAVRNGGILETNRVTSNQGGLLLQVADSEIEADDDRRSPSPSSSASHDADAPPPPPVEPLDADGVTIQGDSLLHVVAACGDDDDFLECAEMIYDKERRLLVARNTKGDTPLHCAASAGNSNMISRLIFLSARDVETSVQALVRMRNQCGETALHHAVRAPHNNEACIDKLMKHDPDLACVLHQDGTSPLYLAISLGKHKIAEHLYYSESRGKLSYSGPDGRNVLHAAVPRGQVLHMILGWLITDAKPREDGPTTTVCTRGVSSGSQAHPTTPGPGTRGSSLPAAAADCLLTQLTGQRDKTQKGSTPLHLAASLEGWPDAQLLHTRFPPIRLVSRSATEGLLSVNKSTAFQADDEGSYPIHVAARAGSLGVVKMLLERCPDCATLRDGEGRTFLHVAAEKERLAVVRYVVSGEIMPQPLSLMILNAQDSNGNTALHGAVRAGNLAVFNCLFRNRQVRLDVASTNGMTPLDLSYTMIPQGFYYGLNPRSIVRSSLLAAGAPHGGHRPELFSEKLIPKRDHVDKEESKKHTEATQVTSIVTALIATVTFASAFQLPGGYRAADSGAAAGTPVLAGSYAFDAFILADTLAFICSMAATCTLVYAGLPAMHISLRNRYLNVSSFLLRSAARSLVAAFGLGLYLVMAPVHHTSTSYSATAAYVILLASSFYGNMSAWWIIRMSTTVLARTGIRQYALVSFYATSIFIRVLVHFWSYIIIFGLPAIHKWLQQKQF